MNKVQEGKAKVDESKEAVYRLRVKRTDFLWNSH